MKNDVFTLNEALKEITSKDVFDQYIPFDMEYRTFNATSKKGGKLKRYVHVTYLPEANHTKDFKHTKENIMDMVTAEKNPNHFENRSRNIRLEDKSIVKIKIDFIISINHKKVIY